MAILYRTAKFKSTNILAIAILDSTAKFNPRQYFRLYGIIVTIIALTFRLHIITFAVEFLGYNYTPHCHLWMVHCHCNQLLLHQEEQKTGQTVHTVREQWTGRVTCSCVMLLISRVESVTPFSYSFALP